MQTTKTEDRTEQILRRAETVKSNLATFTRFNQASKTLASLDTRHGSLAMQLLLDNIPQHLKEDILGDARATADGEAQRALMIMESELGL